jgi:hypothetical protein
MNKLQRTPKRLAFETFCFPGLLTLFIVTTGVCIGLLLDFVTNDMDSEILLLIISFLILILNFSHITCIFDKNLGMLILKYKGLYGIHITEYGLLEISSVKVKEYQNQIGINIYRLTITLLSGENLSIYCPLINGIESAKDLEYSICSFLSLVE